MSTHGPLQPEVGQAMLAAMQALDDHFNPGLKAPDKKVGLVLLVFPYNDHGGRSNYVSNGADREDMIVLLRELADRFEGTHPEERE